MTTADAPASGGDTGAQPPQGWCRRRRLYDVGKVVDRRVTGLQERYLADSPQARGELAGLRRAVARQPGEVPEVWDLTQVASVPDTASDAPTWEEVAVHTAVTLYALHQQSQARPVHVPGVGLGAAARRLVELFGEESSTRKRFNALVTSATVDELRHHLGTLVSLLRSHDIVLDYAMLADDVHQFQRPDGPRAVRLRWARQYYAIDSRSSSEPDPESRSHAGPVASPGDPDATPTTTTPES
ncbi:type I-E CRISPR-associated protein Cse2/CasB [Actinomyces wuliandei]|uniref:type I-E CRISPR-associated protein Cse2/CasB n=1 Tax=Actinomyces wuliandei TaxID=2057743 RepID=UPI00111B1E55|nr:type I-E CRISPR-associated protein Cse2/CasB [Actinomyces wuliandei]